MTASYILIATALLAAISFAASRKRAQGLLATVAACVLWFGGVYLAEAGILHFMLLFPMMFLFFGALAGTRSAGKAILFPCVPLSIYFGYLGLGRVGLIDYPQNVTRNFVSVWDLRMMKHLFGDPLPPSFDAAGCSMSSYDFPAPDGPSPACYWIKLDASDLPKLKDIDAWTPSESSHEWALAAFDHERYESILQSSADTGSLGPGLASYKTPFGSITVDSETSPRLNLYLTTILPYQENQGI